jgi:hypothetical protein
VEKRLKKALAIYPESHQANALLAGVRREQTFGRMDKAFRGGDMTKVAHIVRNSADPEIRGYFFNTIEHWRQELASEDKTRRLSQLSSMYGNCLSIDKKHPTTLEIAADLKRLEAG